MAQLSGQGTERRRLIHCQDLHAFQVSGLNIWEDELMMKDECILVNYMDEAGCPRRTMRHLFDAVCEKQRMKDIFLEVVGHNNKYNCHKFAPGQPRGLLSRAEHPPVLVYVYVCVESWQSP